VFAEKKDVSLFFLTVTVVLLGLSLAVHCLLYAGFNTRDQFPLLWDFLQYAIIIGFIPAALNWLSKQLGITKPPPRYVWGSARYEGSSSSIWGVVFGLTILVFFMYAWMSWLYWYVGQLNQWNPYISVGQYFAYHKMAGNKVRSLSAEEYTVMSLYYARAWSSHWPACHSIALAILYAERTEQIVGREAR
jgi:hypothetical protein